MAKPTLVSVYAANATPDVNWVAVAPSIDRQTDSFSVLAGDILVIVAASEQAKYSFISSGPTGGSLTYTSRGDPATSGNFCRVAAWTATVDSNKTMAVTLRCDGTSADGARFWGFLVYHFRGSAGIGNVASSTAANSAPSQALTAAAANSSFVYISADWDALSGSTRTWRTINSITPTSGNGLEKIYFRDASIYSVYSALWDDVGATGSKTTGLSAPTGQENSMIAIEVKGSATAYTIAAGAGAYLFSGKQPTLRATRLTAAAAGSYTLTGINASFALHHGVLAAVGSYTFTGVDVAARLNRLITAGAGSYLFAGIDAAILRLGNKTVVAGSGAYAFTGIDATITKSSAGNTYTINALTGAYAFTGRDVFINRSIFAPVGSYSFTGKPATMKRGSGAAAAAPGNYLISGIQPTLRRSYQTVVSPGVYAFNGVPVILRKSGPQSLVAAKGAYNFTGTLVSTGRGLIVETKGSYSFTGKTATLRRPVRKVLAAPASYSFTGKPATFFGEVIVPPTYSLAAATGAYNFTATNYTIGRALFARTGAYRIVGKPATNFRHRHTIALPSSYAFTGKSVTYNATGFFGQLLNVSVGGVEVRFGQQVQVTGFGLTVSADVVSASVPIIPFARSVIGTTYAGRSGPTQVPKPPVMYGTDTMILSLFAGSSDAAASVINTTPAGWTLMNTPVLVTAGDGFKGRMWVYWKRATFSEPDTYDFYFDDTVVSQGVVGAYGGVVLSGNPIDAFSANSSSSGAVATATGVTTTIDKTELIYTGNNWENTGALSPPTGMRERFDGLVYWADEDRPDDGATGDRVQTLASDNPWQAFLVVLETGMSMDVRVYLSGTQATVSAGVITHDYAFPEGLSVTVTAGDDSVVGIKYAWNNNELVGLGELDHYNMMVSATAANSAVRIISSMKWGPNTHYAETMFNGDNLQGMWGLYHEASDTGTLVQLETGNIVQRPSGTVTPMFPAIHDTDTLGVAYNGTEGRTWFRLNEGPWNMDLTQSPDSRGIGLWEPPPTAGCHGELDVYVGPPNINDEGTVLENLYITKTISVRADNVTFRNCLIEYDPDAPDPSYWWGIDIDGRAPAGDNVLIENCTIIGGFNGGNSCIGLGRSNIIVRDCDLQGYDNGLMVGGTDCIIEGNYIHNLARRPGQPVGEAHVDGIQSSGCTNLIIRDNWIEGWDTSNIILKADGGPITNVLIEGNTLMRRPGQGIAFPIYVDSVQAPGGVFYLASGVVINRNRIQRGNNFFDPYVDVFMSSIEAYDNIDYVTGLPILTQYSGFPVTGNAMNISLEEVDVPPVEPTGFNLGSVVGSNSVGIRGPAVAAPVLRGQTSSLYRGMSDAFVEKPAGVVANDFLVVALMQGSSGGMPSAPVLFSPGWEQIGPASTLGSTTFKIRLTLFGHRATAVEPDLYTFGFWEPCNSQWWCGAYSGVRMVGGVDVVSMNNKEYTTIDDVTAIGHSVFNTQDNDKLLWLGQTYDGAAGPPTGMNQLFSGVVYAADETIASYGNTGNRTQQQVTAMDWSVFMLSLRGI